MKKLNVLELAIIPALVALTIIVRILFAPIPGVEFTTPIIVVLSVLMKRHISFFYLIIFLLTDSLLNQQGNITYMCINIVVWVSIYLLCQLVKYIKPRLIKVTCIFVVGFVSVLFTTAIWLLSFPLFSPQPIILTFNDMLVAWMMDFATWHPIVAGFGSVILYGTLLPIVQLLRLNTVFDIE